MKAEEEPKKWTPFRVVKAAVILCVAGFSAYVAVTKGSFSWEEVPSFAWLFALQFGAIIALAVACKVLTLPLFRSDNSLKIDEIIKEKGLARVWVTGCVIAPLAEEFLFRWVPHYLLRGQPETVIWGAGVASALVFAILHGSRNEDGSYTFPLPQFFSGIFSWYFLMEFGYAFSVIKHMAHNMVAFSPLVLVFMIERLIVLIGGQEKLDELKRERDERKKERD